MISRSVSGSSCFVLAALLICSTAAAQSADVGRAARPLFRRHDALVGAGVVAAAAAIVPFDVRLAEFIVDFGPKKHSFPYTMSKVFDNLASPGAILVGAGAYAIGRVWGNTRLADLGLHTSEAVILTGAETYVLKGLAGRDRPLLNPNDATRFRFGGGVKRGGHNSMPSGHTSAAFAAVAALNGELESRWSHGSGFVGPLLYTGAGLVGVARVYGSRHWPSDVIVGALVGTSTGIKVVRYNHAHSNNRIDRWLGAVSFLPSPMHPETWLVRVGS